MQRGDGFWGQSVDAAGDISAGVAMVEESCDGHRPVGIHIQRFLIVDIVGHSHQSVSGISLHRVVQSHDIVAELLLAEYRVHGGKTVWCALQIPAYLV